MSKLPFELAARALAPLDKANLKNARLVCRLWSFVGAQYLFDKVFISPHQPNIDVFEAVTQHPTISKHVKELHYDTAFFPNCISERAYVIMVYQETKINPDHILGCHDLNSKYYEPDPHKRQFLTYLDSKAPRPSLEDRITLAWRNLLFMQEGYRKYLALEKSQKSLLAGDYLKEVMINGLRKLDRLGMLVVRDSWCEDIDNEWSEERFHVRQPAKRSPYETVKRKQGSPLARSWDNFYLQPRDNWTYNNTSKSAQVSVAFRHVVSSLLEAQRPVQLLRTLDVPTNTISHDTASSNTLNNVQHAFLAGLETLEVLLPHGYAEAMPRDDVRGNLQATLGQACNLKHLTLTISDRLYLELHRTPVSCLCKRNVAPIDELPYRGFGIYNKGVPEIDNHPYAEVTASYPGLYTSHG